MDGEAPSIAPRAACLRGSVQVQNGLCGLLYAPLQLHCPHRKAAQAILLMVSALLTSEPPGSCPHRMVAAQHVWHGRSPTLTRPLAPRRSQEEVRATQRAFNARFDKLLARKHQDLDKLDERAARIAEIQKASRSPCTWRFGSRGRGAQGWAPQRRGAPRPWSCAWRGGCAGAGAARAAARGLLGRGARGVAGAPGRGGRRGHGEGQTHGWYLRSTLLLYLADASRWPCLAAPRRWRSGCRRRRRRGGRRPPRRRRRHGSAPR